MQHKTLTLRISSLLIAAALAGCSSDQLLLQNKVDYRGGSDNLSKNALEVPPDLSAIGGNANFSVPNSALLANETPTTTTGGGAVLPSFENAKLVQADGARWLVVKGDPAKVWPEIREFWLSNGFLLTLDNPQTGILETDWLENRATLPSDMFTNLLSKVAGDFLSTGELDKFRTRIERGSEAGTVEIYVTHRGMREVFKDGSEEAKYGAASAVTQTIWTGRPSDPELETEMLSLLLQRFGMTKEQASNAVKNTNKASARAQINGTGDQLELLDGYDRAWRRVGLAFDRIGYVVQDRNRNDGTYIVERAAANIGNEESNSVFGSLAFWRSKEKSIDGITQQYQVKLSQKLDRTLVTVTQVKGDSEKQATQRILQDLLLQLK